MAKSKKSFTDVLRVPPGPVDLTRFDAAATRSAPGGKAKATRVLDASTGPALATMQEKLYAQAGAGGARRVLLVLQGMDTAGKGGVIDHVVGLLGPSGTSVASFKRPTPEELAHHFLWRIRRKLPVAGQIGVFDRSHYEDVLVTKVHGIVDDAEVARRYEDINRFEAELAASGTTIVKCFLHVSYDQQRDRLLARLDDPDKHWKFRIGDVDERGLWPAYTAAYEAALEHTSTDVAPWYVVPADHKWYRNWAVSQLLYELMSGLDLQYPDTDLDV
ncbi:MAG: PPK2 family polyphosphate kinase, partial [Janthinobacterium lividum]